MRLVIREYLDTEGASPFREWIEQLDLTARARVQARIQRFEGGNLGDHKALGGGLWEARLHTGPGCRIYFGKAGRTLVLLLCGGSKSSQVKDIRRARSYWDSYLEEPDHGETK